MKNSKGFIQIIIILVVLVLIGGAYYFGTKNKINENTVSEIPITEPTPDTSSWKDFSGSDFSVKTPSDWIPSKNVTDTYTFWTFKTESKVGVSGLVIETKFSVLKWNQSSQGNIEQNTFLSLIKNKTSKTIKIGGIEGTEYSGCFDMEKSQEECGNYQGDRLIIVSANGSTYQIGLPTDPDLSKDILSTFEFTN